MGTQGKLAFILCAIGVSAPVRGAEEAKPKDAAPTPIAAAEPLRAIVHGFYVEGLVGGGYAPVSAKLAASKTYPGITPANNSEALGAGAIVQIAAGYEIVPAFALELTGGMSVIAGGRIDRVRDLSLAYGGLAARGAVGLSDRWNLLLGAGIAYVSADDGVEAKAGGAGVLGRVGLEYFFHVRHFSAGASVTVLAPLSPTRLFVALTPHLRYAF